MSPIDDLSSEQRSVDPYLHIDPGFVNRRKCYSVFGNSFVTGFESRKKPSEGWPHSVFNDHLIVDLALRFCRDFKVGTLGVTLGDPKPAQLFCSTETLAGNDDVYDKERITNAVVFPYESDWAVELEFGTRHIVSDTGKLEQSRQAAIAIIGQFRKVGPNVITVHPLIMGAPSFDHPWNREVESRQSIDLMWHGDDWFETFPEDIDEFSSIKSAEEPSVSEWQGYMRAISEEDVKQKCCQILGDVSKKDWGGELDDHFSTSLHLSGRRVSSAFAFKGPSRFREMTPDLLGKRADQIYRLAATPANLLAVQHCHMIGEAVRATLRAFAVAPHNPRRYCFIDGKDTFKLLSAYNLL